jgi:hypothetical protein
MFYGIANYEKKQGTGPYFSAICMSPLAYDQHPGTHGGQFFCCSSGTDVTYFWMLV